MVRLCCQTQIKWWPSHCLHPIYSPQPEVKLSCLTDVGFWNAIPSYSQGSETCSQILLCPSLQTSSQWSLRLKETHHCHTQTGIPQDIQSLWVQPHWQSPECSGIFLTGVTAQGQWLSFLSSPLALLSVCKFMRVQIWFAGIWSLSVKATLWYQLKVLLPLSTKQQPNWA